MYLHALALKLLHIQPRTFMHIVGVVEIVLGIVVLTRYTRYAAYVVMVWLWCIALDRVSRTGHRNLIGSVRLGGVIGG
jgi:hypothetical protein